MTDANARACVACGSPDLKTVETITAVEIAEGWRRGDVAEGSPETADRRVRDILAVLPERIRFDRCAHCGLEMAAPPVRWSADAYPRDQPYPVRWEFDRCIEDLGPSPLDVLELGCGTGEFLSLCTARGHRVVGIDFTDEAVAIARGRGLDVFCGSLDDLPRFIGHDRRFDALVLFQVIEHVPDPDALFSALEQWIRPAGRVFIACPGPRRFTRLIREQLAGTSDFWDYPPSHVLRWTLPALTALVERHGWRVVAKIEEPLSFVAAGSQMGVTQAIYGGHLHRAFRRRLSIGLAWLRLMAAGSDRRAGVSIYLSAMRPGQSTA